jgi:hypothetical protein
MINIDRTSGMTGYARPAGWGTGRDSIMMRSFADCMGFNWPKEIAMMVDGEFITFKQILDKRKKEQKDHLEYTLNKNYPELKPCIIWVFENRSWLFGGWWLYVRTLKEDFPIGFRSQNKEFKVKIMQLFPCGIIPLKECFEVWAENFARQYPHKPKNRKKQGLIYAWAIVEGRELRRVGKTPEELKDDDGIK